MEQTTKYNKVKKLTRLASGTSSRRIQGTGYERHVQRFAEIRCSTGWSKM